MLPAETTDRPDNASKEGVGIGGAKPVIPRRRGSQRLLSFLLPDLFVRSVHELEPEVLAQQGIRGVILDLDGTLAPYGAEQVDPAVRDWVQQLRNHGISACLVTNGRKVRVRELAAQLGLPCYSGAAKPLPFGLLWAGRAMGLKPREILVVGDQLFTDVLAGKVVGMRTARVEPLADREPIETRVKRPLERLIFRLAGVRPSGRRTRGYDRNREVCS